MTELGVRYVTIMPRIATGFSTEINAAVGKGAAQAGKSAGKSVGDGIDQGVKQSAPKVGAAFKSVVTGALVLGGVRAVSGFVSETVSAFNAFEDAASASEVVFGSAVSKISAMAEGAAKNMGISKTEATEAAITFGAFGKSAGLAGDDLAGFSAEMVQLAGDMASFRGTSADQAIQAIGAAFRGETEPIRAYQVMLDDATLRQEAFKMGLISSVKEGLTPQQKVLAAHAQILAQTKDMQGDYNRTAEQGGNVQKTLQKQSADLAVEIGEKLQPAMIAAQKAGIGMIEWAIQNEAMLVPLAKTLGTVTLAVGGFVAVSKGIEALKAARATIAGLGDSFMAMSTKAKIATASAGAVGLALTAGALIYGSFAQANANAEAAVAEFTTAIELDTGALGENTRAAILNQATTQGLATTASKMGISAEALTDALMGNADAVEYVGDKMADYLRANADNEGAITGAKTEVDQLSGAMGTMSGQIATAESNYKDYRTEVGKSTTATETNTTATKDNAEAQKDLYGALRDVWGQQLAAQGDNRALEAAYDDAKDAAKEYREELVKKYRDQGKGKEAAEKLAAADIKAGKALDVGTEAGRKNEEALDKIIERTRDRVAGMVEMEASEKDVNAVLQEAQKEYRKTAKEMGAGKEKANELSEAIKEINSKRVDITVNLRKTGISNIQAIPGKGHQLFTMKTFGGGGAITGGYRGRDSVPALLMPDEHVLTTEDVKNLGGHQGVLRMRSLAGKGMLRFATGGPVMPTYKGHSLDYWEDYLLTDLEETRLQIRIKDLKADLAEKETYYTGKGKKRKKKKRYKLRDLERTEATLELRDAEEQLRLAKDAAKANASAAGTIQEQITRYETALKISEDAASSWQSAAASLGKGGFGSALSGSWKAHRDAAGNTWYSGSSAVDVDALNRQKSAEGDTALAFLVKVDKLRQMGAPKRLVDDILALGAVEGSRVADAYLAKPSAIQGASDAYDKIALAQSGMEALGALAGEKAAVTVNVTTVNPQAEKPSETVNRALQYAAQIGVGV